MTETTPDYAGLIESLDHRASTMNGAEPVGAGEGHTYVTGYYTVSDRMLDREAATALRALLERNKELERERDELKHDIERYVAISSEEATRAEAADARVKELEAENACLRERQAEADRVIDMVEEDPALARSLARSYRDKGRE